MRPGNAANVSGMAGIEGLLPHPVGARDRCDPSPGCRQRVAATRIPQISADDLRGRGHRVKIAFDAPGVEIRVLSGLAPGWAQRDGGAGAIMRPV
jgi:hypothetical protein